MCEEERTRCERVVLLSSNVLADERVKAAVALLKQETVASDKVWKKEEV